MLPVRLRFHGRNKLGKLVEMGMETKTKKEHNWHIKEWRCRLISLEKRQMLIHSRGRNRFWTCKYNRKEYVLWYIKYYFFSNTCNHSSSHLSLNGHASTLSASYILQESSAATLDILWKCHTTISVLVTFPTYRCNHLIKRRKLGTDLSDVFISPVWRHQYIQADLCLTTAVSFYCHCVQRFVSIFSYLHCGSPPYMLMV